MNKNNLIKGRGENKIGPPPPPMNRDNLILQYGADDYFYKKSFLNDGGFDYYCYVTVNGKITLIIRIENFNHKEIMYWNGVQEWIPALQDRKNKVYISDDNFKIVVNKFVGQLQFINDSTSTNQLVWDSILKCYISN